MEQLSMFGVSADKIATIMAWVVGLQLLFHGIGAGLTEIALKTENKYDNMIGNGFAKVAWFMGTMISKFGYSMPKQVVIKKAEAIKAKEDSK